MLIKELINAVPTTTSAELSGLRVTYLWWLLSNRPDYSLYRTSYCIFSLYTVNAMTDINMYIMTHVYNGCNLVGFNSWVCFMVSLWSLRCGFIQGMVTIFYWHVYWLVTIQRAVSIQGNTVIVNTKISWITVFELCMKKKKEIKKWERLVELME